MGKKVYRLTLREDVKSDAQGVLFNIGLDADRLRKLYRRFVMRPTGPKTAEITVYSDMEPFPELPFHAKSVLEHYWVIE